MKGTSMAAISRLKIISAVLPINRRYAGHIEVDGVKYPLAGMTDPEFGMPDAQAGTYDFERIEEMPGQQHIAHSYGTAIAYFKNAASGEIQAVYGGMAHRNGALPMTDGGMRMNGVDFDKVLTYIRSFPNRQIQLAIDEEELGWIRSKFRMAINTTPTRNTCDLRHVWPDTRRRARMTEKPARPLWLMLHDSFVAPSGENPAGNELPSEASHGVTTGGSQK